MATNNYTVVFARSARKELERLPGRIVERAMRKIEGLSQQPRPQSCRKLAGVANLWRIKVGDYRVIYRIDDSQKMIDITAVRHRQGAYD